MKYFIKSDSYLRINTVDTLFNEVAFDINVEAPVLGSELKTLIKAKLVQNNSKYVFIVDHINVNNVEVADNATVNVGVVKYDIFYHA